MTECSPKSAHDSSARASTAPDERIRKTVYAEQLFCGATEIIISHNGEQYRLRRTSKGKLILTK